MDSLSITRSLMLAGLVVCLLGIGLRLGDIIRRPLKADLARRKGSPRRGVLYAFTLGMAPWEKESTRLHWLAYLRGVLFHLGVFAALGVLAGSAWLDRWPRALVLLGLVATGAGSLFGFLGLPMRWRDANLRLLSLADDYAAVALTSVFILLAAVVLVVPAALPAFYAVAALLLAYIPFGKIRHCLYFFYSKFFFGLTFGRRGVVAQPKSKYAE